MDTGRSAIHLTIMRRQLFEVVGELGQFTASDRNRDDDIRLRLSDSTT
jgi:hypothetical protein